MRFPIRKVIATTTRVLFLSFGLVALGEQANPARGEQPPAAGAPARPAANSPATPQTVVDPDRVDNVLAGPKAGSLPAVDDDNRPRLRQREGAKLVDRRGRFELRGDRVIFLATNPDAHFVVLENLSLERVTRVLEESGSQLEWSVSGTLTEFRASNYLQISRALVKSLPAKGEPRKLADPLASSPLAPAKP
ncbi:MAG: hypothetical protein K8U03_10915 [Planctomycetia bacterium]|nr:hypothetical protein [Planctomycetia bacterium]